MIPDEAWSSKLGVPSLLDKPEAWENHKKKVIREIQADAIRNTVSWIRLDPHYDGRPIFGFVAFKLNQLEPTNPKPKRR